MNDNRSREEKIKNCVNPKIVDQHMANFFNDQDFLKYSQRAKDNDLFSNYAESMGKKHKENNELIKKLLRSRSNLINIYLVLVTKQHDGKNPDFKRSFHGMVVVETESEDHKFLLISHQRKGKWIITSHYKFPFNVNDPKWSGNSFDYNSENPGGIFFSSQTKKATVQNLVRSVLRWWTVNDLISKGGKSQFPASCYGLAESMLYLYSKNRNYPNVTGEELKKPLNPFRFSSTRSRPKTKLKCPYGVKKSGGCKKKPGPKKSLRKVSRRRSRKVSRRRSRKSKYMTVSRCKDELKDKIRINIGKYHDGGYVSRAQAIAVAYAQIKKKYHQCKEKI